MVYHRDRNKGNLERLGAVCAEHKQGDVMKLLIHDLTREEWKKIASEYNGWKVVADSGLIKPCVGCFGCWTKTPGECVIKDSYERMGALIHKADEVVVMTKYTYGGFSSFVKNVFDRSIGLVLPFFEIVDGEMHHKNRYPEAKKVRFIFRGASLTEEDKTAATEYVHAVCKNFRTCIPEIIFEEDENAAPKKRLYAVPDKASEKTILLNCSMRGANANSKKILNALAPQLKGRVESIDLVQYIKKMDELKKILNDADRIVFGTPLYVDGIPSSPLRVMEMMEKEGKLGGKTIYVVSNMGFYESDQLKNLMAMFKRWSENCGYTYGGGLAVGAGEMVGSMMKPGGAAGGPSYNASMGLERLAEAVNASASIEDIYADAFKFPRKAYMFLANLGWPRDAKKNGLKKKDLFRRIED